MIKIHRDDLFDILLGDYGELIENKITGTSRWSTHHSLVFALPEDYPGKIFMTKYTQGATEQQDESPWEYDTDSDGYVNVDEVRRVEKITYDYEVI